MVRNIEIPAGQETMTVRDAARILEVHENTIRNWMDAGSIAYRELAGRGGYRRPLVTSVLARRKVTMSDVDAWIERQLATAPTEINDLTRQRLVRLLSPEPSVTADEETPEEGHTFRISVESRTSSKVVGDAEHHDAGDFMGLVNTVEVRAWNLADALVKASRIPFATWFSEGDE